MNLVLIATSIIGGYILLTKYNVARAGFFKSMGAAIVYAGTIIMLMLASTAHAGNYVKECAPTAKFEAEKNARGQDSFSFSVEWKLGKSARDYCNRQKNADIDLSYAEELETLAKTRKANAEAREEEAKARQEEIEALEDKIKLCSDFTTETAPASIKTFCGDLLN